MNCCWGSPLSASSSSSRLRSSGHGRRYRRFAPSVYEDSLTSLEQVMRIARDIDQQRILVDDHILESEPSGIVQVENQLSQVATDLYAAERVYGPLVELPNEDATWRQASVLMAHHERGVGETLLVLSRQNNDREARADRSGPWRIPSAQPKNFGIDDHQPRRSRSGDGTNPDASPCRHDRHVDNGNDRAADPLCAWPTRRQSDRPVEEQLVGYSSRLEGRNRELDAFAGRIAHDLRNPVASLTLSLDLMSRKASSEEAPALDRMRRSIKRISTMIDDLLAFARADARPDGAPCNPSCGRCRQDPRRLHRALRRRREAARNRSSLPASDTTKVSSGRCCGTWLKTA